MAKSPTPIPAPPVKIHRGAPGSAPARQRRRRKKVNPFVLFLRGLARRLYFGIKTAFKFLLFVPVLVFMVAFSYNVDRSGLFQGALAPRRIVDLMLQGYDVTNFEQMDEREGRKRHDQILRRRTEEQVKSIVHATSISARAVFCSSTARTPASRASSTWASPARTYATT